MASSLIHFNGLVICVLLYVLPFVAVASGQTLKPFPNDVTFVYDTYLGINLHCKFGSIEIMEYSEGFIEAACSKRFENISQTLADGTLTYPHLIMGSKKGYLLTCKSEIDNGQLDQPEKCTDKYLVGSSCHYKCNAGHLIMAKEKVTCRLMMPIDNVTAHWWPPDPCTANLSPPELSTTEAFKVENTTFLVTQIETIKPLGLILGISIIAGLLLVAGVYLFYKYFKRAVTGPFVINLSESSSKNKGIPELDPHLIADFTPSKSLLEDNRHEEPVNLKSPFEDNNDIGDLGDGKDFFQEINQLLIAAPEATNNSTEINIGKYVLKESVLSNKTFPHLLIEEECQVNVRFLYENKNKLFRDKLRGELEIIEGRPMEHTLAGYFRTHWKKLNFASENAVKVIEQSYLQRTDQKVSEEFLQTLSQHGYTIGKLLDYFYNVGAYNVIAVVLEVHGDCCYCCKFK